MSLARPPGADDQRSLEVTPSYSAALGERVSLGFSMPISYHAGEDSGVLDFAATLEVPVDVIRPAGGQPVGVRVTPFGTVAGSAAGDGGAGGFSGDGGVQGTATLTLGGLNASISTRVAHHEGLTMSYETLRVDPAASRQVLENGIRVSHSLGDGVLVVGSLVHTQLRQDAAVEQRTVPGIGVSWQRPGGFNLSLGWTADLSAGAAKQQVFRLGVHVPF